MKFLTINTGHLVDYPRERLLPGTLSSFLPLVKNGGGIIPYFSPYRVEISREQQTSVFSIHKGADPITLCGLAWGPEGELDLWYNLESIYLEVTDSCAKLGLEPADRPSEKPSTLPWLAAILLPAIVAQPPEAMRFIGEIEAIIAWSIISHES